MHYLYKKGKLNELQSRLMSDNKPEFELYNIKEDPHQLNNLADRLPGQVSKMNKLLLTWKTKVGDTILDPDRFDMEEKRKQKNQWASSWYKQNRLPENPTDEQLLKFWLNEFDTELE